MLNLENLTNSIKEYLYGIDDYEESAHELIGFIDRVCLIREDDSSCECGLNPNEYQSKEQRNWETECIKESGKCSACVNSD